MYGVCLQSGFHLYDIDCARCITRSARVTLRDWLTKNINDFYPTKFMISEIEKRFNVLYFDIGTETKVFLEEDEITVQRDGTEIKILAKDFNKETDLLGIE